MGSQYQIYSQLSEIPTSSSKQLGRSLTFKKRGKPKKNEDDNVEWPETVTNLVIDFWQVQELLYHAKHPKYHIREENSRTLSIVQQNMCEQRYEFTTAQISYKSLSLKNYFCKEKGKVTASSEKSGSGTDELYESNWRFYECLNFLDYHITPRQTFSNLNVGKAADGSKTGEVAAAKPPEIQKLTKDTEVDPTALIKTAVEYMKTISVDEEKEKSQDQVFADVMAAAQENT